ncbi:DUF2850 domain-containing protein [Vibrio sp. CAU 1672]|uniref:DUF2850 domain-containing protein n=1 Tax=Vibrio sp. CAU 1672 TaxID=3032594 RepID=UPI0023DC79E6|nr:DUF2850 domain-containing protein [Vibrio sp. CAU 1672]MDF2155207.1 DUF2850 domain-containing protein [Vibrio sp. CAU 1672]
MATSMHNKKTPSKPATSFWSRHQTALFRSVFILFAVSLISVCALQVVKSYQEYTDPSNVYGDWLEIGAPPYRTETLTFSAEGVFRDHRLIATQFDFDGKVITIDTGLGQTAYQTSGSHLSPQIRRIEPSIPDQRFIKKGFEHTVKGSETGVAVKRRAALSQHFNNK